MATREDYIAKFKIRSEAIVFEDRILDSGSDHLPKCALLVMKGHEPTSEYWDFLIQQLAESVDSTLFLTAD